MSGKICKYIDSKIINTAEKQVQDKFREEIGSYFQVETSELGTNQRLVFRNYRNNPRRKINIDVQEPLAKFDVPGSRTSGRGSDDIGYATSPELSLGTASSMLSADIDETIVTVSSDGDTIRVREREIETLPSKVETIVIQAKANSIIKDGKEFFNYVKQLFDTEYEFFEDNFFTVTKPPSKEEDEVLKRNSRTPNNSVSIDYNYNFYNEEFERIALDPRLPEVGIQNLYNYVFDTVTTAEITDPNIPKKIALLEEGKNIDFGIRSNVVVPRQDRDNYRNIYVPYDLTSEVNKYSRLSKSWPMTVNFKMRFDKKATLPRILKNSELADLLIRQIGEAPFRKAVSVPNFGVEQTVYTDSGKLEKSVDIQNIREVNVLAWFEDAILANVSNLSTGFDFFGPETEGTDIADGEPASRFLFGGDPALGQYEGLMLFIMQLENLVESKKRSFQEILNGKKPDSEIVAYRVAKFDASRPNSQPIQNYYILNNSDELDIMNFVDSQVKYGKKYRYIVYSYHAVFGTSYSYENFRTQAKSEGWSESAAQIDVVTRPSLRMYEVPIYQSVGQILEHPPVPPNIDVIPLFGVGDKLRFHMNGGTGVFKQDPVVLKESDVQYYRDYRESFDLKRDDPITYMNNDSVSAFEIFRIETPPTSYDDFRDNLRVTVNTDIDPLSAIGAASAAYIENLAPNRKYYYTFRALDVHGQPSPPTVVYELEMIDDGATIFPIIRAYDMPSREERASYEQNANKAIQAVILSGAKNISIFSKYGKNWLERFSNRERLRSRCVSWGRRPASLGQKF
jgi:hypothetical protein